MGNDNSIDDPVLQRDIGYLFKSYLKRDAIWDMTANFPIIIYLARNNALWKPFDDDSYRDDYLFWLCMGLKTLRLHNAR